MRFLPLLLTGLCSIAGATPLIHFDTNASRVKVEVDMNMTSSPLADVLFVVDNSGSMDTHQKNLVASIPILVDTLIDSGLNFHAAVLTTDMNIRNKTAGVFVGGVVSSQTPNAKSVLAANLLVGTSGDMAETVFSPVMAALTEPLLSGPNAGFLRPGASLNIVFVTDAEDQSKISSADFVTFLKGITDPSMITLNGILSPSGQINCPRDQNDSPVKIESAIADLGGHVYSLCASNFTDNVAAIGRAIGTVNKSSDPNHPTEPISHIHLPLIPQFDSIVVNYGTQILPANDLANGWSFDWVTNEIVIGKDLHWSYQPVATPLTITFLPTYL